MNAISSVFPYSTVAVPRLTSDPASPLPALPFAYVTKKAKLPVVVATSGSSALACVGARKARAASMPAIGWASASASVVESVLSATAASEEAVSSSVAASSAASAASAGSVASVPELTASDTELLSALFSASGASAVSFCVCSVSVVDSSGVASSSSAAVSVGLPSSCLVPLGV